MKFVRIDVSSKEQDNCVHLDGKHSWLIVDETRLHQLSACGKCFIVRESSYSTDGKSESIIYWRMDVDRHIEKPFAQVKYNALPDCLGSGGHQNIMVCDKEDNHLALDGYYREVQVCGLCGLVESVLFKRGLHSEYSVVNHEMWRYER